MKIEIFHEDSRGNVFRLLENLAWMDLNVPAGFESDGASVPRLFWRLIFPPTDPKALFAAVLHDFVYRTHPAGWTKKNADVMFRILLKKEGIPHWRAWLAWLGVALFGGPAWKKNNITKKGE